MALLFLSTPCLNLLWCYYCYYAPIYKVYIILILWFEMFILTEYRGDQPTRHSFSLSTEFTIDQPGSSLPGITLYDPHSVQTARQLPQ